MYTAIPSARPTPAVANLSISYIYIFLIILPWPVLVVVVVVGIIAGLIVACTLQGQCFVLLSIIKNYILVISFKREKKD